MDIVEQHLEEPEQRLALAIREKVVVQPIQRKSDVSSTADTTLTRIEEAIRQASSLYFRLVIVTGVSGSGKTAALQSVARTVGCSVVNVNQELSKKMLEVTRSRRSRQVERLLKEVIAPALGEVVVLDNIEILFDTGLEVEPLRLLQRSSRNRTVVASWSGTYVGGTLTYAEPGHPEFVQFKQVDALVIPIGNRD